MMHRLRRDLGRPDARCTFNLFGLRQILRRQTNAQRGDIAAIHALLSARKSWMRGTSPRMTISTFSGNALAASVAVATLAAAFSNKRARAAAAATVEAYRTRMRALAKLSPLEIWHSRIDLAREVQHIEDRRLQRQLHAVLAKAGKRLEQGDNFPHLVTGKQVRIADKPPVIYHFTRKSDARHRIDAERIFASYKKRLSPERRCLFERYVLRDMAFKAVGVGSVGTFCAIGLFMSYDGAPLLIQIKEAGKSVLECFGPKFGGHRGRRVVEGQRTMQAASDIFLGWTEDAASARHFYVRELKNRRLGSISEVVEENALVHYAQLCGRTLARAHARTLSRSGCTRRLYGQEWYHRRCVGIFRNGLRDPNAKRLR
jgi:Uncharacterized protein conserved in bacteria (DUF2252)